MTRFISLFVFTFLFLSFVAYSFPGKYQGRHGKTQWWDNAEVLEQLELTGQQRSKIDEIASSNEEALNNLHTQLRASYKEFKESMRNPNSTEDEILSKYDRVEKSHKELSRLKIETTLDIREILSPEQITKLFDINEQHWNGHRDCT
jgi:Spy/CpxP family protein refolding chaperone